MAEREVRIKFTGDTGVLKGQAGELRTLFGNLVNDTNDVRDAGLKWADAYSQQSKRIRQDMEDVSRSAAVLADSLGPEMVAALDSSGRSVEEQVQELLRLGLTHDDIRASSNELAAAIKERDDVLRQSTGQVGDGLRSVAAETDKTRSVMANFAGNAAQELPLVSDALGPLNTAVGQFAEYAAEGDINLKSLAKNAGPLLGVTVAIAYINNQLELMRAKDAFRADRVRSYQGVIQEAGDDVQALADHLREVGKIEATTFANAGNPFADAVKDITDKVRNAGLTVDQYAKLVAGGQPAIEDWIEAQRAAGNEAALNGDLLLALAQDAKDWQGAQEALVTNNEFFAATQADVNAAVDEFLSKQNPVAQFPAEFRRIADALSNGVKPSVDDVTAVTKGLNITNDEAIRIASNYADELRNGVTQAHEDAAAAAAEAEQAERDLLDARRSAIDTAYAVQSAQDAFTEALERSRSTTDDSATAVDEHRQALDDAARAALSLADAVAEDARAKALANGQTLSDIELDQLRIAQLYTMAASLDVNSPLRAAIIDHIHTLQGVPSTVITNVAVSGVDDAATRIGGVKASVDEIPAEVPVGAAADTDEAREDLEDLKNAAEEVPSTVKMSVEIEGGAAALLSLRLLKGAMDDLADSARTANREVGRVLD